MNLFTLLEQSARRYPDKAAILHGTSIVHSYSQLRSRSLGLAGLFSSIAKPGDRIVIATANCPQYVEMLFACWAAGMVAVPLNAKLHPREMGEIIEDAGARLVLASPKLAPILAFITQARGATLLVIGSDDYERGAAAVSVAPHHADGDDLAWLFFTSGTTGRSKGAMLSHRNLMAMATAYLADFDCVEPTHSLVHAAPMSHGSGLYIVPYVARAAAHVVPLSDGFDPGEFLEICSTVTDCAAFLAPTMVQRLRLHAESRNARPSGIRTIVYGGGPMYVDELEKSLDMFGDALVQLYGQGEAPMTITGLRRSDHAARDPRTLASVGWPRSGVEVAVLDAHDHPSPVDEIGEIACRGDVVMHGYWQNPDATAQTLRNGWLHTGDMGSFDSTGRLTLHDRSKDVIISGGSNIYPREIEEVLIAHPMVAEASVVGRKDDEWGEIVVAFVVAKENAQLDSATLDQHCIANIARFKRPKVYHFIEALPKSSYGKVLKRELVDRL